MVGRRLPLRYLLAALAAAGAAWYGLAQVLPPGVDFYHWYYLVPQAWWSGETRLYDEASRGYYLPPWAVWLFRPFSFFGPREGMALFTLVSLLIVAAVSFEYARLNGAPRPGLVAVPAVLSSYALETYVLGMPDSWSLLGAFLALLGLRVRHPWLLGAALTLAAIRPQNILVTGPALLVGLRDWSWRQRLAAGGPPLLVLLVSALAFGWDWPLRWYDNYQVMPPSHWGVTTTYTALQRFGVPFWLTGALTVSLAVAVLFTVLRRGLSLQLFDLTLVSGAIVAPYIRGPSYVVLMALPWTGLASRRPRFAALAYLLTLPTVLVPLLWYRELSEFWVKDVPLFEVAFPVLLLALLLVERGLGSSPAQPAAPTARECGEPRPAPPSVRAPNG